MLTGELRNQIDGIWNDFWSGGLANPLQVIEQITYLIFIKRLDDMQQVEELKSTTLGEPLERRIFPKGKDDRGVPYENMRWSKFKNFEPREMFRIVDEHIFPFIRALNGAGSAYAQHMRDARFQIPSPALLAKVVDKLDMRCVATPRATFTNTCWLRSPPPAGTANSARPAISSRRWWSWWHRSRRT